MTDQRQGSDVFVGFYNGSLRAPAKKCILLAAVHIRPGGENETWDIDEEKIRTYLQSHTQHQYGVIDWEERRTDVSHGLATDDYAIDRTLCYDDANGADALASLEAILAICRDECPNTFWTSYNIPFIGGVEAELDIWKDAWDLGDTDHPMVNWLTQIDWWTPEVYIKDSYADPFHATGLSYAVEMAGETYPVYPHIFRGHGTSLPYPYYTVNEFETYQINLVRNAGCRGCIIWGREHLDAYTADSGYDKEALDKSLDPWLYRAYQAFFNRYSGRQGHLRGRHRGRHSRTGL